MAIFSFYNQRAIGLVGVYPQDEFQSLIKREKARSNRTESEFSLVVFIITPNTAMRKVAELLKRRARIIDSVGWLNGNRIGIVLPGASLDGAKKFSDEIRQKCQLGEVTASNIYTYPSEWLRQYKRNSKIPS